MWRPSTTTWSSLRGEAQLKRDPPSLRWEAQKEGGVQLDKEGPVCGERPSQREGAQNEDARRHLKREVQNEGGTQSDGGGPN